MNLVTLVLVWRLFKYISNVSRPGRLFHTFSWKGKVFCWLVHWFVWDWNRALVFLFEAWYLIGDIWFVLSSTWSSSSKGHDRLVFLYFIWAVTWARRLFVFVNTIPVAFFELLFQLLVSLFVLDELAIVSKYDIMTLFVVLASWLALIILLYHLGQSN